MDTKPRDGFLSRYYIFIARPPAENLACILDRKELDASILIYSVESMHEQAWLTGLVMDQFNLGEPESRPGGCAEEEILVFYEMRKLRRVQLQNVAR